MKITTHWFSGCKYVEITINEGSGTIESGLLDAQEREGLAEQLRNIADEIDPRETTNA